MNMDVETAQAVLAKALAGIQAVRPEPVRYPTRRVDIYNPTCRVKVIYPLATVDHTAGLGIEPGQTIANVEVAEHVIAQMQDQGELVVTHLEAKRGDVAKAK